jgi:hypothetical protein
MTVAAEPCTRAEIIEALVRECTYAKRQPRAIELFEADPPTRWTASHRRINDRLTELEATT